MLERGEQTENREMAHPGLQFISAEPRPKSGSSLCNFRALCILLNSLGKVKQMVLAHRKWNRGKETVQMHGKFLRQFLSRNVL